MFWCVCFIHLTTHICIYPILLHGQDVTQSQFLNGVPLVWIQCFHSLKLVAKSMLKNLCCGADKHVGPANDLRVLCMCEWWQPKTTKGDKRQDDRYNKSDDFIAGITNVYVNVRGGCMWSSARWFLCLMADQPL